MFKDGKYDVYLSIVTMEEVDDCQHIAAAVAEECDCIISWNFKHIVNIKTIHGIRAITKEGIIIRNVAERFRKKLKPEDCRKYNNFSSQSMKIP